MKCLLRALLVAWLVACSAEPHGLNPAATDLPTSAGRPGPAWMGLGLQGRLIIARSSDGVWQLDLATGDLTPLFQPEPGGSAWVNAAAVSPDGRTIVLAYAPPPPAGEVQFGYTDLYLLPADGSTAPQPFLARGETPESYFNPSWSGDGRYIYYAHFKQTPVAGTEPAEFNYQYLIERAEYPAGPSQVLVENAYWPRLSRDGTHLAYVSLSADFTQNRLFVADSDGSQARPIESVDGLMAIDAPVFTPDGTALLFSAPSRQPASQRPAWDWLAGVRVALAHNIPSEWWRVAVTGGQAEQLTQLAETGLYGEFSPDGRHLVFTTARALMVMDPDGQNLVKLMEAAGSGTVGWAAPSQ
jgi:Tol biopolymer transport system component